MAEPTKDKPIQGIKLKLKLPSAAVAASQTADSTAGVTTPATVPNRPKIKLNVGKPAAAALPTQSGALTQGSSQAQTEKTLTKQGNGASTSAQGKSEGKIDQQGSGSIKPSSASLSFSIPGLEAFANLESSNDDADGEDTGAGPMGVVEPSDLNTEGKDSDVLPESQMDDGPPRDVKAEGDLISSETSTKSAVKPSSPPVIATSSVTFVIPKRETNTPAPVGGDATPVDYTRSASVMTVPADDSVLDQRPSVDEKNATGMVTPGLFSASAANSDAGTPLDDDGIGGTGATTTTPAGGTPGPSSLTAGAGKVVLQGKGRPYLRAKKPLKEVLKRILADIRRKDVYGLFLDPVDEQEFPGYLDMIGGSENAMDLATMEEKIDAGRYKTMDQFEADVDKMIRAAQVFNPDDSLVHREAGKIKTLAEKHILKSRPIIRTPSPSPEPVPAQIGMGAGRRGKGASRMNSGIGTGGGGTPMDVGTPASGGGGRSVSPSAVGFGGADGKRSVSAIIDSLQTHQVIPEQMLDYPANSDLALTVGWYLTGGKRFRSRKEQRAKEKWDGQWREWYTTGDRNLREAEDLPELLSQGFTSDTRPGERVTTPKTIDWSDESMRATEVWQPAPTYTGFEHEERPPSIPMRPVGHLDYGRYQHLPSGYGYLDTKPVRLERDEFINKVKLDLRPPEFGPASWAAAPWLRPEEDPMRYLKAISTGEDVAGEAYLRSVDKFVKGAEEGAKRNWSVMRDMADGKGRERKRIKLESGRIERQQLTASGADSPSTLGESLSEYVSKKWRGGVFNLRPQRTIDLTTEAYKLLKHERPRKLTVKPDPATPESNTNVSPPMDPHTFELSIIKSLVQDILRKLPLRQEVLDWSARREGLDLAALLHAVQDFAATGPGGGPPTTASDRGRWFADSLRYTGDMIVHESRRLEAKWRNTKAQAMDNAKAEAQMEKDEEDLSRLRDIRLNLAMHELRPMTSEEAARLPGAVRNLIKIIDRPPGGPAGSGQV
ncbi:hypothetical protein QFC22_004902 [Naganishia vaughanmartiniae]|uniref:Uncharacterized protein n=1 Tax=Naganishia vaughanmartiniae TaxID=1424756 RepID=A0ACC2WZ95_9TREE|nr:hypothetical protein QFC22_004902 [Naganishia vaughanmartiniae]